MHGGAGLEGSRADSWICTSAPQIRPRGPHNAQSKGVPGTAAFASAARGQGASRPPPCSSRVSPKASARARRTPCS